MDWLKLFALLVVVASVQVKAEGPKKKIRIHLPQKVKHIHHHKKVYITNHPAPSQYAPAYLPSAEGAVAVPTNVGLPAVASLLPLNSVELVDEPHQRIPGLSQAGSKLLPLYRQRGYYGPNPSEWDDHDYDAASPPEPAHHAPPHYSPPSAAPVVTKHSPSKRVKIIKLNEIPRKKVRKIKPKRVVIRGKPQPEEEHPVTTFHEQFYSDLEGSGTIRKLKKPPRVEKIIDGDTEHIHTYSEEHIHKLVFDDQSKVTGVVGVDPAVASSISAAQPLLPLKNAQSLLALHSEPYLGYTAVGSMGTPSHMEYAAYNPRDVTHDHIFHEHGEIPNGVDITKDALAVPPKVSYNSQGLRIFGGNTKRPKNKQTHKYYNKPSKPSPTDFSYYESIYTPSHKSKKYRAAQSQVQQYDSSSDVNYEDFNPLPSFNFRNKPSVSNYRQNPASTYYGNNKQASDFRVQASVPAPFSLSSTVVHDYKPKTYYANAQQQSVAFSNFKDPFVNFKDAYSNNFEYDTQASSSNLYSSNNSNENSILSIQGQKGKKQKSISTLNISFGGHDHQTVVNHLEDGSSAGEVLPTAFDNYDQEKSDEQPSATPYTIKASSPAHPYYSAMARQALHGVDHMSVPEASNDHFQYAEAPTPSTTAAVATSTTETPRYFKLQSNEPVTTDTPSLIVTDQRQKYRAEKSRDSSIGGSRQKYSVLKELSKGVQTPVPTLRYLGHKYSLQQPSQSQRGELKYGDKI